MPVSAVNKFVGLDQANVLGENAAYSPDMMNFKITENYSLKKRCGIKTILHDAYEIDGLWSGYIGTNHYFLYVSFGILYKLNLTDNTNTPVGDVGSGKCVMFEFSGRLYILNGSRYSYFDGVAVNTVSGYVPIIAIGCLPDGSGTSFENLNLLTPKRRQRFSSDGTSTTYKLAENNIDSVSYITVDGIVVSGYTCNSTAGTVTFGTAPGAGLDNVEICYTKQNPNRTRITNNRYAMLFGGNVDGRLFIWGNPDFPNYRFHSELANGVPSVEYFPENNFTVIGNTEITDIVSQYDRQLIFTKNRAFYSYCELRQDTLGRYYSSFPVYNLNGEKGNLIKGSCCMINNEPITFCGDGLNRWSSTAVQDERNAVCFSMPVTRTVSEIIKTNSFGDLRLYDFQSGSELIFYHNTKAYIYNYRLGVWYAYGNMLCDCFCDCRGELYFSYSDTIYKLDETSSDDDGYGVIAYWKSPFFSAGQPFLRKDATELSVTLRTVSETLLDLAVNSDLVSENIFEESFYIPNEGSAKISCLRIRPNIRRASKFQIYLRAAGSGTDAEIHEICLLTKTKGKNGRYEL
ncbi:MAG: hypothetical protein PHD46_00385 [Eubacteriales bacterium]|nr:hypothetical protein [Eubacteriales bacterium]MDD4421474.1 hypothetical protein [Eubacteriales bacterium]HBR32192.1 hypothetical protein [Clostridiales bacterium]